MNEKNQKVTQGTTFLENPPSLRGEFSYATTFRFPVCCQCNGPMPVLTPAHGSTVGRHCRLCRQRPSRQPAAARLPRGTRHEGLVRVHTCRLVPLDHVPLAGSLSLKGRQPESYKYQSGRRRTGNSEASPLQKPRRTVPEPSPRICRRQSRERDS